MPEEELVFDIKIQNCVATANLFTTIDLVPLFQRLLDNAEYVVNYNPDRFPGMILKIKDPKISSLVFSSGKIVITGAKSDAMVHVGLKKLVKILKANGTTITEVPEVAIQNIVASGNFNKRTINLELAAMWLDQSMYEPEQFPGLIYRLDVPKTVLLLFQSGNIVCTGAKTEEQVHEAFRAAYANVEEIEAFDT